MGLYKNIASQKIAVFAWDTANDTPKTGDAANITAQITKDFGTPAATNDANPTELDATDHPGIYVFDLTQAETSADVVLLSAVSATSDIAVEPVQVFTVPPNFRALGIESDGDLTKVNTLDGHTAQTGDSFARLGAPAGASVSADVADLPTNSELTTALGTLNDLSAAEVNAEVDTALSDYDGPTYTEVLNLFRLALRKDAAIATDLSALLTAINADLASGGGTFANTADALEAIRDHVGDGTNLTEAGGTGDHLTAINLPNQTMDITGSLSGSVGSVTGAVGSVTGNVGGNVTGSVGSLATQAKADVNAEVDGAIETYHLDHLLAATYDPASKPGAADALLNEMVESDAGVSRFTANALEQGPSGGSAPSAADIADAVLDEALSGHTTAGTLGKAVADIEADATAILEDTGTTLQAELDGIQADTEDIQTRLPAALVSGRMASDAVAISGSTVAADAVETNIANLDDAVSDAVAAPAAALTSYDPPTHTELTTAIDGLNDLDAAGVRSAVGLSSANLDTQLQTIDDFLDTEIAAIKAVTDQLVAAQAEPASVPAANATPLEKLAWIAALARNRVTQTATTQTLRNDANDADIATAAVSDDGTTFVRGEFA